LPTAVAYATQLLPGKDLDHLRFFATITWLTSHPTPGVIVAKELGSDVPRHAAESAAVTFDVVIAGSIERVWRLVHARLTLIILNCVI